MKILLLNGSCNTAGNTFCALSEIGKTLEKEGVEYEIFQLGAMPIRDCLGCGKCKQLGKCVFDDDKVNEFVALATECDGFIFGTPVYYAHPSGRILSFLDRVFCSNGKVFSHKPGASVAVARRAGTTASFDVLNKYFGIWQMPVVGSTYWNNIHGAAAGEVLKDPEGLQTLRNLAKNMIWLIKSIEAGKKSGISAPDSENSIKTNFIR